MSPRHRKKSSAPKGGSQAAAGPSSAEEEPPYIEAFGHKYHHSGRIFTPFDEKEQQRMEIQHRLFRHCLNGALTATRIPLNTERILDLGTGTGVWPLEMAVRYPQAQILGIDVSRIQKTQVVPPNVQFTIGNIEDPWPVADESIDFLHARSLAGGVTDWSSLFKQAYDKLKPGGILEWTEIAIQVFDFDGNFGDDEIVPQFITVWRDLCQRNNIEFTPSPHGPVWLVDAGFENIAQRTEILPMTDWTSDEKLKVRQALINLVTTEHFDNHCGLLFTNCGLTREYYEEIAPTFLTEIRARCRKPYTLA
ncbi:S-adenosyl-L-methionine-dependent methyltransferase [Nemania sp. FL0916]|nr:S-adenosyl-L-methionine-dependent methyltransferase [Nemania sp. FL0916]